MKISIMELLTARSILPRYYSKSWDTSKVKFRQNLRLDSIPQAGNCLADPTAVDQRQHLYASGDANQHSLTPSFA